jgi:hypothetical protein
VNTQREKAVQFLSNMHDDDMLEDIVTLLGMVDLTPDRAKWFVDNMATGTRYLMADTLSAVMRGEQK